jgi:hypothetical protein
MRQLSHLREPIELRIRRRDGLVTRHTIRRLARLITQRFEPEKIILFGSFAYGDPTPDSDQQRDQSGGADPGRNSTGFRVGRSRAAHRSGWNAGSAGAMGSCARW